jgi:hypothetical protein
MAVKPSCTWLQLGRWAAAFVLLCFVGLFVLSKWDGEPHKSSGSSSDKATSRAIDTNRAKEKSTMSVSIALENAKMVWSPNRTYQAVWQDQRLVVRTADGKLQYESRTFSGMDQTPAIRWLADQRVSLIVPQAEGKEKTMVTIDVKQKKEVN